MSEDNPQGLPAAVMAVAQKIGPEKANEDGLVRLREGVAEVDKLEQRKADLEAELKDVNIQLNDWYFTKLVDLLDAARVPEIVIERGGNLPPVKAKAAPYYHANISSDWPPEQRALAFKWMDENGHGDLIKTEVTASFPRGERKKALELLEVLRKRGWAVTAGEAIPWNTLTKWLKEQVEDHGETPPLDVIGGKVGRKVTLKPVEEQTPKASKRRGE